MCDYSLENIASRPTATGDRLVTTTFPGTSSRGFCAAGECHVAVCLRPGTELAFDAPVSFSGFFRFLLQMGQESSRTARFRQLNEGNPVHHHDALEFANGQVVLLTKLRTGQFATVIQLPVERDPQWQQPGLGAGRRDLGLLSLFREELPARRRVLVETNEGELI